jgi:hypothetical protein
VGSGLVTATVRILNASGQCVAWWWANTTFFCDTTGEGVVHIRTVWSGSAIPKSGSVEVEAV